MTTIIHRFVAAIVTFASTLLFLILPAGSANAAEWVATPGNGDFTTYCQTYFGPEASFKMVEVHAYGAKCVTPDGQLHDISMTALCRTIMAPDKANIYEVLRDYNAGAGGWDCWQLSRNVVLGILGTAEFDAYCRDVIRADHSILLYTAPHTAYDWACAWPPGISLPPDRFDNGNELTSVCRYVFGPNGPHPARDGEVSVARYDYHSATSIGCNA